MRSASSSELAGSGPEEGTLPCIVGRKGKKVWPNCRLGMMLGRAPGSRARRRGCEGVHGGGVACRAGQGAGGGRQVWALRIQAWFSCTTLPECPEKAFLTSFLCPYCLFRWYLFIYLDGYSLALEKYK